MAATGQAADALATLSDLRLLLDEINLEHGSSYNLFKDKQKEAIIAAMNGDVICVLPTGYGKTLIIESLPFAMKSQFRSVRSLSKVP